MSSRAAPKGPFIRNPELAAGFQIGKTGRAGAPSLMTPSTKNVRVPLETASIALFDGRLSHWRMAGRGAFVRLDDRTIESRGGPGLYWFTGETFADFELEVDWRIQAEEDNSGVFLRVPTLGGSDPDRDWRPAVTEGYEIQIDDRGYDPEKRATGSALHLTGAIYRLAPARSLASRGVGAWNRFRIVARGTDIRVALNGVDVAHLDHDVGRRRSGHIALQGHHEGSHVQFRDLRIRPIDARER